MDRCIRNKRNWWHLPQPPLLRPRSTPPSEKAYQLEGDVCRTLRISHVASPLGKWRITRPLRQRRSSRRDQQTIHPWSHDHPPTNPPPHSRVIQHHDICCLDTHGL